MYVLRTPLYYVSRGRRRSRENDDGVDTTVDEGAGMKRKDKKTYNCTLVLRFYLVVFFLLVLFFILIKFLLDETVCIL